MSLHSSSILKYSERKDIQIEKMASIAEDTNARLDAPELPKSAIPDTVDDADDGEEGEDEIAVKEGALCLFSRAICKP